MKNFYSTLQHPIASIKCMTLFWLIFFFMLVMHNAKAQNPYRADAESNIHISVDSNKGAINEINNVYAQAAFVIKDGVLDDITWLNLSMPINKATENQSLNSKDSVSFKLTHVMVLPIMKKVHAVGVMVISGVSTRTDIEFNFEVNSDQTITLSGAKCIKLDDYRTNTSNKLVSCLPNNNELKLSMNLIFKNEGFSKQESVGVLAAKGDRMLASTAR